jgi:hypothetical protein
MATTKTLPAKTNTVRTPKKPAGLKPTQKIALGVGAVGCFVLALSVWHCTEALNILTGSPLFLAALLAIGIDVGMVACEMASILGSGEAKKWADRYIGLAVALSAILNSVASGSHATGFAFLAYAVGACIPLLVFVLGKVAGHLWKE